MTGADPYNLQRFLEAQEQPFRETNLYQQALAELRAQAKRSHWMWFIFPQLAGLGHSPTAQFFAISGLEEAATYLAHDVLGPRLTLCTEALLPARDLSARQILGTPDDLKLRSSMTLFSSLEGAPECFNAVITAYFEGKSDPRTLALLSQ